MFKFGQAVEVHQQAHFYKEGSQRVAGTLDMVPFFGFVVGKRKPRSGRVNESETQVLGNVKNGKKLGSLNSAVECHVVYLVQISWFNQPIEVFEDGMVKTDRLFELPEYATVLTQEQSEFKSSRPSGQEKLLATGWHC